MVALVWKYLHDVVPRYDYNDNDNEREFIQRVVINKSRTR